MSSRRRYPDTEPQQQTAGAQRMPQKRLQASAEKETYFFVKRKSTALWKNKIEKTKAFTVTVDEEMEAADRAIAGERKLCVCLSALSIFSWRGGASVVLEDRDVHSTGQTRDENWSPQRGPENWCIRHEIWNWNLGLSGKFWKQLGWIKH